MQFRNFMIISADSHKNRNLDMIYAERAHNMFSIHFVVFNYSGLVYQGCSFAVDWVAFYSNISKTLLRRKIVF